MKSMKNTNMLVNAPGRILLDAEQNDVVQRKVCPYISTKKVTYHVPPSIELSGDDVVKSPELERFKARAIVRTQSGRLASLLTEALDENECIGVLSYAETNEHCIRRKKSFSLEILLEPSQVSSEAIQTPERSSEINTLCMSHNIDQSDDEEDSSSDIFVKRESFRTPDYHIDGASFELINIQNNDLQETDFEETHELFSDSEVFFVEEDEDFQQSEDRLGWLDEDEVEELFGLPMSVIKRKSRSWWKEQIRKTGCMLSILR